MRHRQRLFVVLHDLSSPLPPIPPKTKFTIWDWDSSQYSNFKGIVRTVRRWCYYCGTDCHGSGCLDHIIPVSRGGLATPNNLRLCCSLCNTAKGDSTDREYLGRLLSAVQQLRRRWRRERLRRERRMLARQLVTT